MSARGFLGIVSNGKMKVALRSRHDSYPSEGLGESIGKLIQSMQKTNEKFLTEKMGDPKIVNLNLGTITEEQELLLKYFIEKKDIQPNFNGMDLLRERVNDLKDPIEPEVLHHTPVEQQYRYLVDLKDYKKFNYGNPCDTLWEILKGNVKIPLLTYEAWAFKNPEDAGTNFSYVINLDEKKLLFYMHEGSNGNSPEKTYSFNEMDEWLKDIETVYRTVC
jgi:RNAse (barnase) inhibitor barstar